MTLLYIAVGISLLVTGFIYGVIFEREWGVYRKEYYALLKEFKRGIAFTQKIVDEWMPPFHERNGFISPEGGIKSPIQLKKNF